MRLAFARGIDAARICQISSKGHAENPLYSLFILARNEQREAAENFFNIRERKWNEPARIFTKLNSAYFMRIYAERKIYFQKTSLNNAYTCNRLTKILARQTEESIPVAEKYALIFLLTSNFPDVLS